MAFKKLLKTWLCLRIPCYLEIKQAIPSFNQIGEKNLIFLFSYFDTRKTKIETVKFDYFIVLGVFSIGKFRQK
jgi:hypothetical protein